MFFRELLARVTGTDNGHDNEIKVGTIHVERDSVCMGDDCTAPNAVELPYREDERLSEFMVTLAESLPRMKSVVWAIYYKHNVIGYVYTNPAAQARTKIIIKDIRISSLSKDMLFCRYYYESKLEGKYPECKNLLEKVRRELEG